MGYMGVVSPAPTPSGPSSAQGSAARPVFQRSQKDAAISKTIMIKKGPYKGYLAQVIDSTESHFHVELIAQLKKIYIEREKTVILYVNLCI